MTITGAMRNASELSWDGPANLMSAAQVAASAEARWRGAMVVIDDRIVQGAEVVKTHTEEAGTFRSPNWGPLGVADKGHVLFYRESRRKPTLAPPAPVLPVDLVKIVAGADDRLINASLETGSAGHCTRGLGAGQRTPGGAAGCPALDRSGPAGADHLALVTRTGIRQLCLSRWWSRAAGNGRDFRRSPYRPAGSHRIDARARHRRRAEPSLAAQGDHRVGALRRHRCGFFGPEPKAVVAKLPCGERLIGKSEVVVPAKLLCFPTTIPIKVDLPLHTPGFHPHHAAKELAPRAAVDIDSRDGQLRVLLEQHDEHPLNFDAGRRASIESYAIIRPTVAEETVNACTKVCSGTGSLKKFGQHGLWLEVIQRER